MMIRRTTLYLTVELKHVHITMYIIEGYIQEGVSECVSIYGIEIMNCKHYSILTFMYYT